VRLSKRPHRALDLRMPGVADQHHFARAFACKARDFHVHLGDQRAGGHRRPAGRGAAPPARPRWTHRAPRKSRSRPSGTRSQFLDEYGAQRGASARRRCGCAPPRGARRSARRTRRSHVRRSRWARSTPAQKPRGLASRTRTGYCPFMIRESRRGGRPARHRANRHPAPIVMAESATLKAGKVMVVPVHLQKNRRRSRGAAGRSRCLLHRRVSVRARWPAGWRAARGVPATRRGPGLTPAARTLKAQRCQPDAPSNMAEGPRPRFVCAHDVEHRQVVDCLVHLHRALHQNACSTDRVQ